MEDFGFKRNKRDIKRDIMYNNVVYTFKEAYGYNKALIYSMLGNNENEILISYNTVVASKNGNKISVYGWYSRTTAEHINTYLSRYGIESQSKKDLDDKLTRFEIGE